MSDNLEKIDELVRRTHVSYELAKEALENSNWDMVEAIIYLEKRGKSSQAKEESLFDKICGLIKKGNETKFTVKKKEAVILSIPVTLAIIITVVAPHVTIVALILALITGHKMSFIGNGNLEKANHAMDKIYEVVEDAKSKIV